jgi:hypothetical protein
MQLKLQLAETILDPPQKWHQLDPDAQSALNRALATAMIQVINQQAGLEDKNGENENDGEQ